MFVPAPESSPGTGRPQASAGDGFQGWNLSGGPEGLSGHRKNVRTLAANKYTLGSVVVARIKLLDFNKNFIPSKDPRNK